MIEPYPVVDEVTKFKIMCDVCKLEVSEGSRCREHIEWFKDCQYRSRDESGFSEFAEVAGKSGWFVRKLFLIRNANAEWITVCPHHAGDFHPLVFFIRRLVSRLDMLHKRGRVEAGWERDVRPWYDKFGSVVDMKPCPAKFTLQISERHADDPDFQLLMSDLMALLSLGEVEHESCAG